jgi:hypothetical protein
MKALVTEVRFWLDAASIGTAVATVIGWLPAAAAVLTIVWTAIRIWETDTVKDMRRKLAGRKSDDA